MRIIAVLAAVMTAIMVTPTGALAGVVPAAGQHHYNRDVCGMNWVNVHLPGNSYYNVYNSPIGQAYTCFSTQRHRLDFQVTKVRYRSAYGYPNISSGWEWGRYSCTGHSGACFRYPVQEKSDGHPRTSIAAWLAPGRYNLAYDIWFNRTNAHPGQDNGTEVMIWLAHPGVAISHDRTVVIDGIRFYVMHWIASHHGRTWNYDAYIAVHPRSSVRGLWLNPFFRDAISHGELSPSWWLTAIDAGFELCAGGAHVNIHSYSLTGLPVKERKPAIND